MYDVSAKPQLYGPGGAYHVFAGRDASRALALGSMDEHEAANASLEGLSTEQQEALTSWESFFAKNYAVRGRLV